MDRTIFIMPIFFLSEIDTWENESNGCHMVLFVSAVSIEQNHMKQTFMFCSDCYM
jgi:hypothetical protein